MKHVMRILVIEDTPTWIADIKRAMRIAGDTLDVDVDLSCAETTAEALKLVRNHCFHGVSIDQNLPDEPGGPVSREKGRDFIEELRAWDPPGFMALFTAYPNTNLANFAGAKAQIPYIVKSSIDKEADDAHEYMTAATYADFFLKQIHDRYVARVLSLVMESGFPTLRDLARDTLNSYKRLAGSGFLDDDAAKDFFTELSKFRENFNLEFAQLIYGIVSSLNLDTKAPPGTEAPASKLESWISNQLNRLEGSNDMGLIKSYFHLDENQKFSEFFTEACATLRETRNPAIHRNRVFAPEDFDKQLAEIFRWFDVVAWLMRLPLITGPYKRDSYLVYTDLNHRQSVKTEIHFTGNVPQTRPGRVFTRLGDGGRLIPLDKGFEADRNSETNRLELRQAAE
ncbi:MAG: response regulator [Pseudomonadota bacterium]